jgi:hypothetical protein
MEELLETVFSLRSMPMLYKKKQVPLWNSLEPAVKECSLPAARKRGPELWNMEAEDIVGIRCQAVPSEDSRL